MGSILCCSEPSSPGANRLVVTSKGLKMTQNCNHPNPDNSSTSDSETYHSPFEAPFAPEKHQNFVKFINQRDFELSSIQKISEASGCSEQKTFIKYLTRIQKEFSPTKKQSTSTQNQISPTKSEINLINFETIVLESGKTKMNLKLFLQHSTKCPICYQLFENLKNMDCQEPFDVRPEEVSQRISLRDSLLEFDQCQKAKRCAECKCQVLNSHEQAEKAMKKYPNSNKYQSKNLKFRKTSLFQPQIKEQHQSDENS